MDFVIEKPAAAPRLDITVPIIGVEVTQEALKEQVLHKLLGSLLRTYLRRVYQHAKHPQAAVYNCLLRRGLVDKEWTAEIIARPCNKNNVWYKSPDGLKFSSEEKLDQHLVGGAMLHQRSSSAVKTCIAWYSCAAPPLSLAHHHCQMVG